MFVPITSEVTLSQGMIVKEIATGRLYELGDRMKSNSEVWGDDPWQLREVAGSDRDLKAVGYLELSEKYMAEIDSDNP